MITAQEAHRTADEVNAAVTVDWEALVRRKQEVEQIAKKDAVALLAVIEEGIVLAARAGAYKYSGVVVSNDVEHGQHYLTTISDYLREKLTADPVNYSYRCVFTRRTTDGREWPLPSGQAGNYANDILVNIVSW